ncbi:hypothetical protein AYI70_g6167 [Smittium culicis]|uniref:Uncharacterized protein n=1 Tax=Smittium culicis TaxID=133412 RepID=A0A1R1XRI4_9FUNG|nr:hypothetical protein AYI70_g6167 [Smittium culicis]
MFGVITEVQSSGLESNFTELIQDYESDAQSEASDTDKFFDPTPNLPKIAVKDIADNQSTVLHNINVEILTKKEVSVKQKIESIK